jgi:hypothetical protein
VARARGGVPGSHLQGHAGAVGSGGRLDAADEHFVLAQGRCHGHAGHAEQQGAHAGMHTWLAHPVGGYLDRGRRCLCILRVSPPDMHGQTDPRLGHPCTQVFSHFQYLDSCSGREVRGTQLSAPSSTASYLPGDALHW